VSEARQQTFIDAPVEVVWELLADVSQHARWWPRVVEVHCEGLDEGLELGCTYREVVQTPLGKDEMVLEVDRMDDCKDLLIRCVKTGTFLHFLLTEAQDGTFVDAKFGMEPFKLQYKLFDRAIGGRYFRDWLRNSLDAMSDAAHQGAAAAGA
jgi:polyketide cyclase/dehydrase/lipid transport protein